MEARLVIFLAFAALTLIANTLSLWFAYKTFANITTTVTETIREFETSEGTREWLKALETASAQAAALTGAVKEQIADFEPVLARAQSAVGFGLAKIDVRFERFCNAVSVQAEKTQNAIIRPAGKIQAAASGLQGVLEVTQLLGAAETDSDANSTPSQ
jgi:hypothetical protein